MREFDDNPHSYGPVLRRIAILAAVVIAVPAMLWAITSFMHTYVAQPVIASPKPLLAPATTASINTGSTGAAAAPADKLPPQPASPVVEARATASDSTAPKVASLATADSPPAAPAQPSANACSNWPAIKSPDSSPAASDGAASDGRWPDPKPVGTQEAAAPAAASDASDDALPASPPLAGPIPLPPRRPAVLAMAVSGPIPLPRARPSDAGAPAESTSDSSGSGFFTHLFGQTH